MARLLDIINRYLCKDTSSLAFWWLPVYEGSGDYCLNQCSYGDYYLDFSEKTKYSLLFDNNGVIKLDYKGSIGVQYNPCAIAQYGLGLCDLYRKEKKDDILKMIEAQANAICNIIKVDNQGIGRLEYSFSTGEYKQIYEENYISAISQGQAISFLIRAGLILDEQKYIETINHLFLSYKYTVYEGGIVNYDERGMIYLEEAITEKISCILDGFIYAMFGAYDYYLYFNCRDAKNIFDNCCNTIKNILPKFDLGFWSRADCYLDFPKMPASKFYHNVHIQQLKALYIISGDDVFYDYYKKWEKYQKSFFCNCIAFIYKCWYKIFLY